MLNRIWHSKLNGMTAKYFWEWGYGLYIPEQLGWQTCERGRRVPHAVCLHTLSMEMLQHHRLRIHLRHLFWRSHPPAQLFQSFKIKLPCLHDLRFILLSQAASLFVQNLCDVNWELALSRQVNWTKIAKLAQKLNFFVFWRITVGSKHCRTITRNTSIISRHTLLGRVFSKHHFGSNDLM